MKSRWDAAQVLAVVLGIALTYIIRPGRDTPFEHGSGGDCATKNAGTIMGKQCAPPAAAAGTPRAAAFRGTPCAHFSAVRVVAPAHTVCRAASDSPPV